MTGFCNYVFFFESATTGEAWVAEHPATFLCSLTEAAALARKLNKRNIGEVLSLEVKQHGVRSSGRIERP